MLERWLAWNGTIYRRVKSVIWMRFICQPYARNTIQESYATGKVVNLGPEPGITPPSFEGHHHCFCIFEWCQNDGMGLEWQGWKLEWPLGRPPHSVVPGPVQSLQGHPCHSNGMRTNLIPSSFHLGMTPKWELSHFKVIPAGNELGMKDFQTTRFLPLND